MFSSDRYSIGAGCLMPAFWRDLHVLYTTMPYVSVAAAKVTR